MASNASRTTWLASSRRADACILALALVLRLAWVAYMEFRVGQLYGPDAKSYHELALSLLDGHGLQKWDYEGLFTNPKQSMIVYSFRPPLLPVFLAGVYGVAGPRVWVARIAMALLSAATCVAVARIARRLFTPRAALAAGLLMAVYPKLIYYSGMIVTENLYVLLLACSIWLLLWAQETERSWWPWPVAGAVMGLAALCRSALLAFPAFAGLWVLIVRPRTRRALGEALLLGMGVAAAMAPWWGRNLAIHGSFVAATTEGGLTFWVTNRADADGSGHVDYTPGRGQFDGLSETQIDRKFYQLGLAHVRAHPGHFLRLMGVKFLRFWRLWPHAAEPSVGLGKAIVAGATFVPILLLAIAGALAARRRWRPLLLIYLLILYYTLLHMVFMAITRYRLPIEPYLIVLAAVALTRAARRPAKEPPCPTSP